MDLRVARQVLRQIEAAAAQGAAVRSLARVDDGVGLEVCLLAEALAALRALEGLFAGVCADVVLEALLVREALGADDAGEGPLPCVDAGVGLEVALRGEVLAALCTDEALPARGGGGGGGPGAQGVCLMRLIRLLLRLLLLRHWQREVHGRGDRGCRGDKGLGCSSLGRETAQLYLTDLTEKRGIFFQEFDERQKATFKMIQSAKGLGLPNGST